MGWTLASAHGVFEVIRDLVLLWFAWQGLGTWKRQIRGNTEFDLARRMQEAVYRVRDGLAVVRDPMTLAGEEVAAREEAGLEEPLDPFDSKQDLETQKAVFARRWQHLMGHVSHFQSVSLEAEVLWAREFTGLRDQLLALVRKLRAAAWRYFFEMEAGTLKGKKDAEELRRIMNYWGGGADPDKDPFSAQIDQCVAAFEAFTKSRLRL